MQFGTTTFGSSAVGLALSNAVNSCSEPSLNESSEGSEERNGTRKKTYKLKIFKLILTFEVIKH